MPKINAGRAKVRDPSPYLGQHARKSQTLGLIWASMRTSPRPQALSGPACTKVPDPRPYLSQHAHKSHTLGLIWATMRKSPIPQALSGPPRSKTLSWDQGGPTYSSCGLKSLRY